MTNPYKGEKHYQCQAQPVGNACAIRMHPPSFVPGGMCIYTHRKSMFHGTYSCSDFLLGGAGIYMSRETSTWVQVQPLGSTQCKLLPELKERKGKEMTWGKRCGMAFRECAVVISWEKNPKRSQWKWGWSGHYSDRKKKRHFLLVVVVPFRNFWFVLLNYGALEFPNYQSTHKALLHSLSVHASAVSYSPKRETFLTNW